MKYFPRFFSIILILYITFDYLSHKLLDFETATRFSVISFVVCAILVSISPYIFYKKQK